MEPNSNRSGATYAVLGELLKRTLRAVQGHHNRESAIDGSGALLERVVADLSSLNRCTEQDFLALGEKLMEFLAATRQISSEMVALRELISGNEAGHASQVLTHVLERSRQIETKAEAGDRALASVCDSARQIERTFRGFSDTVSVFRVLGSLTRIETARLGGVGAEFGNLAEEVDGLVQSIESSGQGILDASSILHRKMQSALTKISGLRASELKELPALIAKVMTGLVSLEDRHRQASEDSVRQAAEYEEVSAAIGDLITAIQFHDITRQQVEHVADALKRLCSAFQDASRSRSTAPPNARAVLTLQSSQLSNAKQVFAVAVLRIEQDLDGIARRAAGMAESSRALMGCSADEQGSFFLQMEGCFTAILRIVGTCAKAEAETLSTLADLEGTVAGMRTSVGEVREIEIRIHRIAINATIRAVQIGDAGNALNVIAEVMQRLAHDSNGITDAVAGGLDAIADAANRLSAGPGGTPDTGQFDADAVLSDLRTAIVELHLSSEDSSTRLNQITALSSQLRDGIQSVQAGFSAGTLFAASIGSACSALAEVGNQIEPGIARGVEASADRRMHEFAANYTMQAERDVHEALAAGVTTGVTTGVTKPITTGVTKPITTGAAADWSTVSAVATEEEDLGDNVELF